MVLSFHSRCLYSDLKYDFVDLKYARKVEEAIINQFPTLCCMIPTHKCDMRCFRGCMVLLNKGEEIRFVSLTGNEGRRYIC
jgi:hypothetical protein